MLTSITHYDNIPCLIWSFVNEGHKIHNLELTIFKQIGGTLNWVLHTKKKNKMRLEMRAKIEDGDIVPPRQKIDYGYHWITTKNVRGSHPSVYTRIAITFRSDQNQ